MRFHIPGLPHTVTNEKYIHCAFTQKVFKLCSMLTSLGHEVYHYGCEGSNPVCTEHIDVIDDEYRRKFYPDEWHNTHWNYNIKDDCHKLFFDNTVSEIKQRLGKRDFFLASWGWGHKPISDKLGNKVLTVESGIGYKDTYSQYRVFESYTWMAHVYGRGVMNDKGQRKTLENGSYFDAVIPNYFDPNDFDYTPDEKEDYFLFLGRIIQRKGIDIIYDIVENSDIHVKVAGQGKLPENCGGRIEHVGFADVEKRRGLLRKAKGLLMPTIYLEPFGGVSIESMLSGTPVISSDWGVFSENVLHGITGYRCRTLDHFVWSVRNIDNISPEACRDYALSNYRMDRVAKMYQEYFEMLNTLWTQDGWRTVNPGREDLSWLDKHYPNVEPKSKTKNQPTINKVIYPIEKPASGWALKLDWYKKPKPTGISFILRAKNEEKTIGMALDSLKSLNIPYEVNVILNQCSDHTDKEVRDREDQSARSTTAMVGIPNIHIYQYPFQLGKTGIENVCTPVDSVHSTIWLLNWAMMRGQYSYTFRWDADFIMTSALAEEIGDIVTNRTFDAVNIEALFSDSGKANTEPYLWANDLIPRYLRYSLWHLTRFAKTSTPKVGTAKNKIVHDSPLSSKKSYWEAGPWWEKEEENELIKSIKDKYSLIKEKIGSISLHARASCKESEELARRVQKEFGIEISEILALKEYASRIV